MSGSMASPVSPPSPEGSGLEDEGERKCGKKTKRRYELWAYLFTSNLTRYGRSSERRLYVIGAGEERDAKLLSSIAVSDLAVLEFGRSLRCTTVTHCANQLVCYDWQCQVCDTQSHNDSGKGSILKRNVGL
jgi:hypothetical protein